MYKIVIKTKQGKTVKTKLYQSKKMFLAWLGKYEKRYPMYRIYGYFTEKKDPWIEI